MDLSFADRSYAHRITGEWAAAEDAFEELLEALRSLPGCEGLPWSDSDGDDDDYGPRTVRVSTAAGGDLLLTADPDDVRGTWTAEVVYDDTAMSVECTLRDSDYFGETWVMTAAAPSATRQDRPQELRDPWAVAGRLLAAFPDHA